MYKALLATHLVLAVFAIGPLAYAAKTAGRGVRRGNAVETAAAARLLRWYSYASLLVVIVGFALMSTKAPWNPKQHVAEFGDTWIWVSVLLWVVALGVIHGMLAPTLDKATQRIEAEESVATLTARVIAVGAAVSLMFLAIVVLMVYRPGS